MSVMICGRVCPPCAPATLLFSTTFASTSASRPATSSFVGPELFARAIAVNVRVGQIYEGSDHQEPSVHPSMHPSIASSLHLSIVPLSWVATPCSVSGNGTWKARNPFKATGHQTANLYKIAEFHFRFAECIAQGKTTMKHTFPTQMMVGELIWENNRNLVRRMR